MTKPKPIGEPRTNYTIETLTSFCSKHKIKLNNNYNNLKVTRDTKIFGKCLTETCNNNFNKIFRQLMQTNGYCIICTKNNKNEKIKILRPIINKKITDTCLKKYGVETFFETDTFKNKAKNTWIDKYGCDNPSKSNDIKNKIKQKYIEKYGVDNPLNLDVVRNKTKQTCLKKYGVEYPSQVSEIAEKASKSCYKRKTYILPSGKEITCQGYEPFALDKLIKEEQISEEDIVTGCKNVPQIWYNDESGKKHRHYVDIFIPSQNRCIEVKSTWTAKKKQDNIYLKQNSAKELGYNYEIWIYNNKKEIVELKL